MPKKPKAPETFDEYVGDVVHAHMRRKGWSQADLADATGIPLTLIGRSIRGTRGLSVQEFERIAGHLARPGEDPETKAAVMIQEVLTAFGGMGKLLAGRVSDDAFTVEHVDNVTYLGRMTPPLDAAADEGGNPDTGPDEGV